MAIRAETRFDAEAISETITRAFESHPHSQGTEAAIVCALREARALTLSLVAEADGVIAGCVAISPITITPSTNGWFGLGPVAVYPQHQRQGIGRALIEAALNRLQSQAAGGCVVLGDPVYYRRFGFDQSKALTLDGVPPEYFQILTFGASPPAGKVVYHPAFNAKI